MIGIKADMRAATRWLNQLERREVPKAAARAINAAMTTSIGVGAKRTAKDTGVKLWAIRRRFFAKARRRAKASDLSAWFDAGTMDIPLDASRPGKTGLRSYALGKPTEAGQGAQAGGYYIPGAFVATGPGSNRLRMYKRTGQVRAMRAGANKGMRKDALETPTMRIGGKLKRNTGIAIRKDGAARWATQFAFHLKAGLTKLKNKGAR